MYVIEFAGQDDRFAAAEAGNAATGVDVVAPGLATARGASEDRVRGLAYTRRASRLLGTTDASVAGARALLEASVLDRSGTAAVRARDVRGTAGVDTRRAERELGAVLSARGFGIDLDDPDHELRALFAGDTGALGWLAVESVRDFGERAPTDKPFFQPGSMDPLEARAVANLAGAAPGVTVVDPMCGTGGILVEAGLLGARVVGIDVQRKMVAGARRNLARYLDGPFAVVQGDAARRPVCDGVDAVFFDAPYGRQSKVAGRDPGTLVCEALDEVRGIADRAVVVADRSWAGEAWRIGWAIEDVFERPVHRSLTRYVHVLAARPR